MTEGCSAWVVHVSSKKFLFQVPSFSKQTGIGSSRKKTRNSKYFFTFFWLFFIFFPYILFNDGLFLLVLSIDQTIFCSNNTFLTTVSVSALKARFFRGSESRHKSVKLSTIVLLLKLQERVWSSVVSISGLLIQTSVPALKTWRNYIMLQNSHHLQLELTCQS